MNRMIRADTKYALNDVSVTIRNNVTDELNHLEAELKRLNDNLKLADKKAKRINTMKRRRLYNTLR